jgi:hypothetical protein
VIAINVANGKTYYVHQDLLTQASPYFRGALEKDFQEAKEKKIDLPHVSSDTIERFIDWLYTEELHIMGYSPYNHDLHLLSDANDGVERIFSTYLTRWSQLFDLYVFGDAHDVPDLRRVTMDTLFDDCVDRPDNASLYAYMIAYIYSKLPQSSPLLRFVVDINCRYYFPENTDMEEEKTNAASLPVDYLAAIYLRFGRIANKIRSYKLEPTYGLDLCDYHDHANQKERDECPRNETMDYTTPDLLDSD